MKELPRNHKSQAPNSQLMASWGLTGECLSNDNKKKPRTRSPGSGYGVVEAAIGPVAPKHRPAKWECLVRQRNGTGHPNIPNFDGSVLDDLVRCRQPGASPAFAITSSARAAVAATWMPCTVDVWEAQAKMWVVPWRGAMLGRCDAEGLAGHDHGAMLLLESQPISPVTTRGWQFQRSGLDSQLASTSR